MALDCTNIHMYVSVSKNTCLIAKQTHMHTQTYEHIYGQRALNLKWKEISQRRQHQQLRRLRLRHLRLRLRRVQLIVTFSCHLRKYIHTHTYMQCRHIHAHTLRPIYVLTNVNIHMLVSRDCAQLLAIGAQRHTDTRMYACLYVCMYVCAFKLQRRQSCRTAMPCYS